MDQVQQQEKLQTENGSGSGPSTSSCSAQPKTSCSIKDETSISDIPPRIFSRILSHVPVSEHKSLTEVDQSWHEFIDTQLGVEIKVGRNSEYAKHQNLSFSPPEMLKEIGISQCYFSNLCGLDIPNFIFPNLLKKLTFIDYISETDFNKILCNTYNVRHLVLDLTSIHYLPNAAISLKSLSKLQTLEITNGTKFCWNRKFLSNWVDITFSNTFNLLRNAKISKLNSLILEFPMNVSNSKYSKFVNAMITCLINHYTTIKKFSLTFDDKKLKGKSDENSIFSMDFNYNDMEKVKLSSCILSFVEKNESLDDTELENIWINFLNTQTQLQECIVTRTGISRNCGLPFSSKLIINNSENLHIFNWYLDQDSQTVHRTINCSVFVNCSNLKELCISSSSFASSTLEALNHLPKPLSKLSIERIYVQSTDAHFIGLELPNLEILHLLRTGQEDGHGLTMESLKEIMLKKCIKELKVKASFAINTFEQASEAQGFFSFIVMLVNSKYLNDEDAIFTIYLQKNGEYGLV